MRWWGDRQNQKEVKNFEMESPPSVVCNIGYTSLKVNKVFEGIEMLSRNRNKKTIGVTA